MRVESSVLFRALKILDVGCTKTNCVTVTQIINVQLMYLFEFGKINETFFSDGASIYHMNNTQACE